LSGGFVIESERPIQSLCIYFHHTCSNEQDRFHFAVVTTQSTQCICQVNAGFIVRAFAPVTEREIAMRFGCFASLTKPLKDLDALGN